MEHRDRDKWERQFARAYSRSGEDFKEELRKIIRASGGWPGGVDAIPWEKWAEYEGSLQDLFDPLVYNVFLTSARRVAREAGATFSWDLINERAAAYANTYSYELVKDISDTDQRLLQDAFGRYYREGMSLEEVMEVVERSPAFGEARAELIAITEVTRTSVAGEMDQAQALLDQGWDLIPIWKTRYDEFVCGECGPRNDQPKQDAYNPDGWVEPPPAHPRCRCWLNWVPASQVITSLPPAPTGEQLPFPEPFPQPPVPETGTFPTPDKWEEMGIKNYVKQILPDTKILEASNYAHDTRYHETLAKLVYETRTSGKVENCIPKVFKMGYREDFRYYPTSPAWADETLTVSTNPTIFWSEDFLQSQVSEKWWSAYNTVTHEFGHIGHIRLQQNLGIKVPLEELTKVQRTLVSKAVSEYGTKSNYEFIAETFGGMVSGKKYSASIMKMYKNLGGPEIEGIVEYSKEELAALVKLYK